MTRKITWHAAAIKLGLREELRLGNLDAKRDWGYAKDYVEAMWLMLQQDAARGLRHRHRRDATPCSDCVEIAFDQAGLADWETYVVHRRRVHAPGRGRPAGRRPGKAKRELGWEPRTSFEQLIRLMVDADLKLLGG